MLSQNRNYRKTSLYDEWITVYLYKKYIPILYHE